MKLSIITVNYNNKDGLQKTIDSVIGQTFSDYEWIIVDGGSKDGSKGLIESYKDKFSYWCSEPDGGVYNAMNKGISQVKGEYMCFMNSGDVFYDKKTLQSIFEQPFDEDMVYGDWMQVYKDRCEIVDAPRNLSMFHLYIGNICHQAMFIKSCILKTEGYDESYPIFADWVRWRKMSLAGSTFKYIPCVVCKFDAEEGLSQKRTEQMKSERARIDNVYPSIVLNALKEHAELLCKNAVVEQSKYGIDIIHLENAGVFFQKMIGFYIIFLKMLKKIFIS